MVGAAVASPAAPAAPPGSFYKFYSVEPGTGSTAIRDYFVAYGMLPDGCEDVDEEQTELVNADNPAQEILPVWKYTDGGFWSVYFDIIPAGVSTVNLKVVYMPDGDEEEATNITVT